MNLKTFLKGGVIPMIFVLLTLVLVYVMKSDFIEAKIASQSFANESQDNDFATLVGPTENFLQTGTAWDLFDDYESWPSSTSYRENDTLRMMLRLTARTDGDCGSLNKDFVDINGDGLVDLLYFLDCHHSGNDRSKYAVLTNNGDNTFNIAYKCVNALGYPDIYYGDCAAL